MVVPWITVGVPAVALVTFMVYVLVVMPSQSGYYGCYQVLAPSFNEMGVEGLPLCYRVAIDSNGG